MNVWAAVVTDLWNFLWSWRSAPATATTTSVPAALPAAALSATVVKTLPSGVTPPLIEGPRHITEQTTVTLSSTVLRLQPTRGFDAVLTTLPVGVPLTVHQRQGDWVEVATSHHRGWVPHEAIGAARKLLPEFTDGVTYDARSEATKRLRRCINDEYGGGMAQLPLQGEEYVTFALWQAGVSLPWPEAYQRVAGAWHRKLKGVHGVHVGVIPRSGAVMEYVLEEVGYVAYVHSVSPDEEVVVSGVGLIAEGMYTALQMTHEEWRERRPVFITVS